MPRVETTKGLGNIADWINAHAGRYMVTVHATQGKVTLLIGKDIKTFNRVSDAVRFLEGIDEGISLMQGELG